jgi:hypothetical protein
MVLPPLDAYASKQAQLIGRLLVNHSSLFGPTLLLLSSTRGARVIHAWLEPVDH